MFPQPVNGLLLNGKKVTFKQAGLFAETSVSVPPAKSLLTMKKTGPARTELVLPASLPQNLNDLFVSVDYLGGNADIRRNGQVLNDHLYHGPTWMVGLKRYLNGTKGNILQLSAYPWNDKINGIPNNLAIQARKEGPRLEQIKEIPQYTVQFTW
ncbi:MAG: hypothetical protein AB2L20_12745 [Mangrovibacterium sp.]